MQPNSLPMGTSRTRFLLLTFALPAVLGYFIVILGVLADATGPREFTYQTLHHVEGGQADFERLKTQVAVLDVGDPRIQKISLHAHDQVEERCEGRVSRLEVIFHAQVWDVSIQEPHAALLQQAYALGLGSPCSGLRFTMESAGSASDQGWLMPLFLVPLAALILLFNGLSRRGWRPLWLNWADWQPSVGRVVALRLGAGYGVVALLVVIALGALADLAGWLPERSDMLPTLEHWPWLIVASLIAPVFEEFIYRAWLLERLTRVMRESTALLLSTASFAAIHLPSSIFEWFNFFLVGLVLGLLWLRTRSLLAVVLAHGLYNGVLLILQILLSS